MDLKLEVHYTYVWHKKNILTTHSILIRDLKETEVLAFGEESTQYSSCPLDKIYFPSVMCLESFS